MPTLHENYITIRDALEGNFDVSELRDVGLTLDISLDPRLYVKAREMVNDLLRRVHRSGQTAALIAQLRQLRSTVEWPADYAFPPDGEGESPTPASLPPFSPASLPPPGPLPDGSRMAHGRNPLFTGREDELRGLAAQLLDGSHPSGLVIAAGIGGIGKTQLAVELAYRIGRYLPGGVQWVSLADEAPDAVGREVIACGAAMGLWPPEQDAAIAAAEKLERTRRAWLAATPRLLIFDNCEDPAVLEDWRPVGSGARVLVTSRNDVWPAGFATLRVATLPRDESRALLREYLAPAERTESDAALDAVADELGDLPLALTVAGSYLADNPSATVERYLADLRRVGHLAQLRPRAGAAGHDWTKHDRDVARTFRVSLDRLEPDTEPIGAAARLALAGATLLVHGEPFPWALAAGMVAGAIGDDEAAGAAELPDAAVRRLLALGLLERAGAGRLRLHRLLAAFAATALAERMDAARDALEEAVISLAARQNRAGLPEALRDWDVHLRHVVDAARLREDEAAAGLCNEMGYFLRMSGDLAAARPLYERALIIFERILGPEHPDTATSLNNVGFLLHAQGELEAARPYYERALAIRERVLGQEHPDTARSLTNLGSLLHAQGLSSAWPYYKRALAINERVLGPEHTETAICLNNLGFFLHAQGDLAAARPYLERALAIRESVLGPEHPATAQSLNNLGSLLYAKGDRAAARSYLERALAVRERVLGLEHPDTAYSCNNLGTLSFYEGDLTAATGYMRRALAIREKVLGYAHPLTRRTRANLAGIESASQ